MGDYDGDGYLDLYVTEWRDFTTDADSTQARLFRNLGAASPGHFEDVTNAAGVRMDITTGLHAGKALSFTPRFSDLDRDGLVDIAVVSDAKTSRVFWNNGDGTFTDGTAAAGINTGTNDMGFTLGDFNGDGLLDWFATSIGQGTGTHPSGNRLFLNDGDRTFTDATDATGVREGGWGWAADTIDFDNDGDLDIAHTNGMTITPPDQSVLFQNLGNRTTPLFLNQATTLGITDTGQGRGLLNFDYDRDGDLDLFIVNYNSAPILYRNDAANNNDWLQVRTIGTASNRDGVGAYITVTPDAGDPAVAYVTEMDASSNYLAQSQMLAHFGLGQLAGLIDQITIEWPSGNVDTYTDVAPNQSLILVEGASLAIPGDFDLDGDVDADDLAIVSANYGGTDKSWLQGDANLDGLVNLDDFDIAAINYGMVAPETGQSLPEPATASIVCCAAALLMRRRS
jgi:hypothetical protein